MVTIYTLCQGSEKMIKTIKKILYRSIDNKEISYENLNDFMKNKKVFLIDVRSNQEYEEGHLNGAINISLYNIEKEIENIVKDKDELIILYCSSGSRSKEAKKILEELGYHEVYNLKGGIDRVWIQ